MQEIYFGMGLAIAQMIIAGFIALVMLSYIPKSGDVLEWLANRL